MLFRRRQPSSTAASNVVTTQPPPYSAHRDRRHAHRDCRDAHHRAAPTAAPAYSNPSFSSDVTYVSGQYATVHIDDGYTKLGDSKRPDNVYYPPPVSRDDVDYLPPVSRDNVDYPASVSRDETESNFYMSIN